MIDPAYRIVNRLPPRPDPQTGQPPPPQAPWSFGRRAKPEHDPYRQRRLSHKPTPPAGRGPVLAWHKESPRAKLVQAAVFVSMMVVGMTVLSLLEGRSGVDWVVAWPVWLIIIAGTVGVCRPGVYWVESVGADWFQRQLVLANRTVLRRTHVNMYELTDIFLDYTYSSWQRLRLRDGTSRIRAPLRNFKFDPPAWDLLFLGIVHSIAAGARINERARHDLMLNFIRSFLATEDEAIEQMLNNQHSDEERATLQQEVERAHAEGQPFITDQVLLTANLTDAQVRAVMHHPKQQELLQAFGLSPDSPVEDYRRHFGKVPNDQVPPAEDGSCQAL